MATQVERMDEMMRFFGFTHKQRPSDLSASALAAFIGVTHVTAKRWERGEIRTPDEVCDRLGINTAWIVGRSSRMWSESFEATRREIRAKLAKHDWSNTTRTLRVAQTLHIATTTSREAFPIALIASVLRLDEQTVKAIILGTTAVSDTTIKRLSEWLDVPVAWFETGDPKTLIDLGYDDVIEEAIKRNIGAGELKRIIMRINEERVEVESVM